MTIEVVCEGVRENPMYSSGGLRWISSFQANKEQDPNIVPNGLEIIGSEAFTPGKVYYLNISGICLFDV